MYFNNLVACEPYLVAIIERISLPSDQTCYKKPNLHCYGSISVLIRYNYPENYMWWVKTSFMNQGYHLVPLGSSFGKKFQQNGHKNYILQHCNATIVCL